jgi:hypothetical protein
MSDRGNFSLDMSDFEKRLSFIGKLQIPSIAKKACWEAAAALKKDADEIEPKSPHLHGNLRGDAVRGVKAKGSGQVHTEWFPKNTVEEESIHRISILVSYLAPYAARWHEAMEAINWSETGVGPKYLEAKMARQDLRDKYFGLIANRIKNGAE